VKASFQPEELEKGDLVVRIIELVADIQNTRTEALPPLHNSVNGEALEDLVVSNDPSKEILVEFSYAGTTVSIATKKRINIRVTVF